MKIEELDKRLIEVMNSFDQGMEAVMRNAETDEKTLEDIKRTAIITKDTLNGLCTAFIEYLQEK